MSARIARRVVISGQVQGVFFRDSARREALRLGVGGWVRNRSDGTVELHAEGDPDAVAQLVLWCGRGPRHASVEDIHVEVTDPAGEERFEVR